MNPQRMRSSHEKFPVRAKRTEAHKWRGSVARECWSYNPTKVTLVKVRDGKSR
jgi:hypothetical protein